MDRSNSFTAITMVAPMEMITSGAICREILIAFFTDKNAFGLRIPKIATTASSASTVPQDCTNRFICPVFTPVTSFTIYFEKY
jgi:hypothetical protein